MSHKPRFSEQHACEHYAKSENELEFNIDQNETGACPKCNNPTFNGFCPKCRKYTKNLSRKGISMPRPSIFSGTGWSPDQLIEITMNHNYASEKRRTQFQSRVRMTIVQVQRFGGMQRLYMVMDDILYDNCNIPSEEFDKKITGIRAIDGKPTRYGTFQIHDMHSRFVYPKGDKWGSLEYAWQ